MADRKPVVLLPNNNLAELPVGDSLAWSLLSGVPVYATRWPTWDEVSGKPTAFPPAAHTHTIADVGGLQAALDGKLANRPELGTIGKIITDWNSAVENGWYMGEDAANAPGWGWFIGIVTQHNGDWVTQEAWRFTDSGLQTRYYRNKLNGTWGAWTSDIRVGSVLADGNIAVNGNVQGARVLGGNISTNTYNPVCGGRDDQSNWNAAGLESFCNDGGWAVITLHRHGYSHVNLIHDGNESLYIGTDGNIGGVQLRANGEIWLGDANNRLYRRRQPRIFVQAGDPGAAAVDGDIWIQP